MSHSAKLKRIPGNTNLRYWHEETYDGYPLMAGVGPFVEQYLEKLYQTMQHALSDYSRVFAVRFDLRLPHGRVLPSDATTNQVLARFKASLEEQISWDRERARDRNSSAHGTRVRLFWVREIGSVNEQPHYHCILFLNGYAYRSLGSFQSANNNMYKRIVLAWARALRLRVADVSQSLHFPPGATYHLTRTNYLGQDKFFHRSSYLCKAATKHYGDGQHGCGGSRF